MGKWVLKWEKNVSHLLAKWEKCTFVGSNINHWMVWTDRS